MRNTLEINLCIADVNEILTKAIRDHVLKDDGYQVKEVFWDAQAFHFRIKLEPVPVPSVAQ